MFEIEYWHLFLVMTIVFVTTGIIEIFKDRKKIISRELKLFLIYLCVVVIIRIVYFPWHHVNGHIDTLKFNPAKILPFWLNLVPVVHLFDIYDGWQMNIIGNITMFIPVGIVMPVCFEKLNTIKKTIFFGAVFPLSIEITQLLFYERCSDIDDLLLNTTGIAIGALIYFCIKRRHLNQ